MEIESLLKLLIGHKVTLTYTPHEETVLRETSGILKEFNADIIHLTVYNNFGNIEEYYLNRHGCTLHSILDEGM